jgi:hypothetical protein
MKRISLSVIFLLSFALLSFGRVLAEGDTSSPMGRYSIQTSDNPVMLSGEGLMTYLVTYENSQLTFKVAVHKNKKCKDYIVISDKLVLEYTCNGEYFGVNLPEKVYSELVPLSNIENLNRTNYFHQKLITRGEIPEVDAIKLIAVYFPQTLES